MKSKLSTISPFHEIKSQVRVTHRR